MRLVGLHKSKMQRQIQKSLPKNSIHDTDRRFRNFKDTLRKKKQSSRSFDKVPWKIEKQKSTHGALITISSSNAGDAVAVGATARRGGRSYGGSSTCYLRDSPGGEIAISTEVSGRQGLSRRRGYGKPGRVRNRQFLST